MIQVGLLRHGEVEGGTRFRGHTDDPLTELGWEQMRATTHLRYSWDRVISSPLDRCASFAQEFAKQFSTPLGLDNRFMEMNFGEWEGQTAADLMADDPEALDRFWADPDGCPPPGGEPLLQFQRRVLAGWESIIDRHIEERVLLVTHGGVIRVLLCYLQQHPLEKLLEIEVAHGALFSLRVSDDAKQKTEIELSKPKMTLNITDT